MSITFDPGSARKSLFAALLSAAHRHGPNKVILEDHERQTLTYGRLISGSMVLGREVASAARPGEAIGVLLPNVTALVVLLFGLNAEGRTVGLLNFTAGTKNLVSAVETGPLSIVVTSRKFVETAQLADAIGAIAETEISPGRKVQILYLEDLRRNIGTIAKVRGLLRGNLARIVGHRDRLFVSKPAIILFTSGTEGVPKGVALTSANLNSNAAQIFCHAAGTLSPADTVMNPLPIFHSFGLTAATLMPILNGLKVVLYPSPLHYKQIPKLIRATKATVLFATDTFLQGYARSADAGDIASVRHIIAGAERVKEQTRKLWAETGAVILEGYGATECSPVISCNLPEAHRPGSVGPVLPGIDVKIEPVDGIDTGGRLLVKGPNVMAGYILASNPGVVVPSPGGWHDTGDIVTLEEGFVTITGRAKRFAKVGGEMISLAAVENFCASVWPDSNHVAVIVPDPKKGESIVLVTTAKDATREKIAHHARYSGVSELALPKSIMIVPAIPVLGSGKVDLSATNELVRSSRQGA